MPRRLRRVQLRRCRRCTTPGHNAATCRAILSAPPVSSPLPVAGAFDNAPRRYYQAPAAPPPSAPTAAGISVPLKFFIHHVTAPPAPSPFELNLKQDHYNVWSYLPAAKPETTADNDYRLAATRAARFLAPERLPALTGAVPEIAKPPQSPYRQKLVQHYRQKLADAGAALVEAVRQRLPAASPGNSTLWRPLRLAGVTGLLLLLVIAPGQLLWARGRTVQNYLAERGLAGFVSLQHTLEALRAARLFSAEAASAKALDEFSAALATISEHRQLERLSGLIPGLNNKVESGRALLVAGQEISLGLNYLLQQSLSSAAEPPRPDNITAIFANLNTAQPYFSRALAHLQMVEAATLPPDQQENFRRYRQTLSGLTRDLAALGALQTLWPQLSGATAPQRYLLVFQNPHELRPTGGFMGSYAIAEFSGGRLARFTLPPGGTYDLQGQLATIVKPPEPLLLANKRWEFQDANWFPDFPQSAAKMLWFYGQGRGEQLDGVIAINGTVLSRLLAVLGPVTDPERGVTFTADNALTELETIIKDSPDRASRRPKQVLSDLAATLRERLTKLAPDQLLPTLATVAAALENQEIQAYFTLPAPENFVRQQGWGGEIIATAPNQDYLLVVNANIQGSKTDAFIKQTINLETALSPDGTWENTLTITRRHEGDPADPVAGKTNLTYLRVYVPRGASLREARGFSAPPEGSFRAPLPSAKADDTLAAVENNIGYHEQSGTRVSEEFGKTVFGNWTITEAGGVSVMQLTYRLPFPGRLPPGNRAAYQLVAQRQSGAPSEWSSRVILPSGWEPVWSEGEAAQAVGNGLLVKRQNLQKINVWSLLAEKKYK
ncbi:MAG: DUF4012 domain-containing protein [Candidatus Magasanikbacteria bacterium]|nr:DUF4012 domain-containing protein [Candidatus Magasanikbacteria bacterium]